MTTFAVLCTIYHKQAGIETYPVNLDDPKLYETLDLSHVGLAIDQFADSLQSGMYFEDEQSHTGRMFNALRYFEILPIRKDENLSEAIASLRAQTAELSATSPAVNNPAKRMAGQLIERLPVIHWDGPGVTFSVAWYWKARIHSLAKNWAQVESLRDLAAYGFDGLFFPQALTRRIGAVILRAPASESVAETRRIDIARELYMQLGIAVDVISGRGDNRLSQILTLTHYGEYVAYYMAIANGVDPSIRPATTEFSARMDSSPASGNEAQSNEEKSDNL